MLEDREAEESRLTTGEGLNIICDPKLIEGVVHLLMRQREQTSDMDLSNDYYREADAIYIKYPMEERNNRAFDEEFNALNYRFFVRCGMLDIIRRVLNEYPIISENASSVVIKKTYIREKAEANLAKGTMKDDRCEGLKVVNLTLSEDIFEDPFFLEKFLRHELMHVVDMLDISFGYEEIKFGETPAEEFIATLRYRVIWDIYISSRLMRMGKETYRDKDLCMMEFNKCYAGLPLKERAGCFEGLWQANRLTHRQIAGMVRDVEKLLSISAVVSGEDVNEISKKRRVHLAGSLCPICRFPSYSWVEGDAIEKDVMALMLKDLPAWNPEEGVCERCVEVYKLKAGRW